MFDQYTIPLLRNLPFDKVGQSASWAKKDILLNLFVDKKARGFDQGKRLQSCAINSLTQWARIVV